MNEPHLKTAYVLYVVEVGEPCDRRVNQPDTKWTHFRTTVENDLSTAKGKGVDIQTLAENAWLIPLHNGLPFLQACKEAASLTGRKGQAFLTQKPEPMEI